jgi:hypothetical protein
MTTESAGVAPLERQVRLYPLDLVCLYTDDCKVLMSKGHQDPAAFLAKCEAWNGGPVVGWGKVRHVWRRNMPDKSGEYTMLSFPATPHARGAYPATTIVDDASYDHDA